MNQDIQVSVKTKYLDDQSDVSDSRYVFGYTITIENTGETTATLISRHWIITDANQAVQEVKGLGVIGEQPMLKPGASYTYTSGVILQTDTGTMKGSYQMIDEAGEEFEAPIPLFSLIPSYKLH